MPGALSGRPTRPQDSRDDCRRSVASPGALAASPSGPDGVLVRQLRDCRLVAPSTYVFILYLTDPPRAMDERSSAFHPVDFFLETAERRTWSWAVRLPSRVRQGVLNQTQIWSAWSYTASVLGLARAPDPETNSIAGESGLPRSRKLSLYYSLL